MNNTRLHATLRRLSPLLVPTLIPVLVALLYGGFLNNPLVFDDLYFFLPGNPEKYVADGFVPRPRWLAYYSHGLTFTLLGDAILWQRIDNLILHAATGLALYALIRELLADLVAPRDGALDTRWAALFAALLFVLHPAAVFGAAYLIQRTTVMATLFSLLCWLSFWRGLNGSHTALWASTVLYLLAVFSKEHAVMAPAVCAALLVLHRRSGLPRGAGWVETGAVLAVHIVIATLLTLEVRHVIGSTYEPFASEALGALNAAIPTANAYPFSVLTQAGLFFKYLFLWTAPNGTWMSIDMREPFLLPPIALQDWAFAAAFFAYPCITCLMLWRGRTSGLLGLALLAPWLLFATEISSVRLQEIFVLYRSYLWMAPLFILVAVAGSKLSKQLAIGLGLVFCSAVFLMSIDRLASFAEPVLLWGDAADLVEQHSNQKSLSGVERIFHNRGLALYAHGMKKNAIDDFTTAISIRPGFAHAYSDRGAAHLDRGEFMQALQDFDKAIALDEGLTRAYAGRAQTLEKLHDPAAGQAHSLACRKGFARSCSWNEPQ